MASQPLAAGVAGIDADAAVEWTVIDLFRVLARRRAWIFAWLCVSCALALLFWITATPRYRATAVIEVQKQSRGAFGLDNATQDAEATAVSDSFDDNLTLQTKIGILKSDAVVLDVIRRTGLENTPDYFGPTSGHFSRLHAALRRVLFWRKPLEPLSIPLEEAPNRRFVALKTFSKRAKIAPAAGTRLIEVSYSDPDPNRAATVANALVQALDDFSFQSRSSSAAQSAQWLRAQLAGLKQQTDTLDARVDALDRAAGSFGDNDAHNVVLARLDELNATLSAAQSNRIVREAIWHAVQSGDPEAISGLSGAPGAGASTQNSFALLQSLRAQEATAKAQIAESAGRYGDNWPALAEQRAGLATIEKSIQDETRRLGERAQSDYEVALQAENSARTAFEQQKALASQITGNAVELRLARQEADASRNLYASLQQRLQQAGVLEGLHSGNFSIVAPALVPPPDHPSSPSAPLLAAFAVIGGLGLGCTTAIGRELTDNTIRSVADLEPLLRTPLLATFPALKPERLWLRRLLPARAGEVMLQAGADADFAITPAHPRFDEALHRLHASLLLSRGGSRPCVITILDSAPVHSGAAKGKQDRSSRDGRPILALRLAAVLAQHGAPALFVNADLRSAPAAGTLGTDPGLAEALAGGEEPALRKLEPSIPLSVLSAGARPPSAPELIASRRMAELLDLWREQFSFVVIHGPAAMYADALVLARMSDAVLLSARAEETRRDDFVLALNALQWQQPEDAVLGVVLENVSGGGWYAQA